MNLIPTVVIFVCLLIEQSWSLPLDDSTITTEVTVTEKYETTEETPATTLNNLITTVQTEPTFTSSSHTRSRGLDSENLQSLQIIDKSFDTGATVTIQPRIRFTEIRHDQLSIISDSNKRSQLVWKWITNGSNITQKEEEGDDEDDNELFFNQDLLIVGKDVRESSAILVECMAPYPITWKHDGLRVTPTLKKLTNYSSSVGVNETVSKSFTLTLYLGSWRFLKSKDKDSGNYTCSIDDDNEEAPVKNQNLATSVYIYVPEDWASNPCTEFACGVNAICQVVHGNRSCTCRAGYVGNPFLKCRPECRLNSDCSDPMVCVEKKCMDICEAYNDEDGCDTILLQNKADKKNRPSNSFNGRSQLLNDENGTITISLEEGPCNIDSCGENAYCQEKYKKALAICHCFDHFFGDPWTKCHPECLRREHCPLSLNCIQGKCQDPCRQEFGVCGEASRCQVVNHAASCSCKENFTGSPYRKCEPIVMTTMENQIDCNNTQNEKEGKLETTTDTIVTTTMYNNNQTNV